MQAALERAWTRWNRVADADESVAYVRKMMTSIFLTWRRRRWWGEIPSSSSWPRVPVTEVTEDALVRHCVLVALASLSPRQRAVVVLRYFVDLSKVETAAALGCSLGTVKTHAARALRQLRSAPPARRAVAQGGDG